MPCSDPFPQTSYVSDPEVEDLLCQAVYLLKKRNIPLPPKMARWAAEHAKADKVRRAEEKAEKRDEADRQAALRRLSARERRLLGVLDRDRG